MSIKFQVDLSEFREKLKFHEHDITRRAEMLGRVLASEIVKHALTLTSETKPGIKPGDGPRRTYPGGWADVTTQLAQSISGRIKKHGFGVEVIIEATAEYAHDLNEREGYEVLGGVDELARQAINRHKRYIFN